MAKKTKTATEHGQPEETGAVEDQIPMAGTASDQNNTEKDVDELKILVEKLQSDLKAEQEALAAEKEQSEKYLKNWQYTQADLENYKKQVIKDRQTLQETMKANALRAQLDVLDDIERALEHVPVTEEAKTWSQGIELIRRKILVYLENEGVKPIAAEGEFDPMLHEAISCEPSEEVESGHIIGVLQQGYQMGTRVLRPSRVRVAL